MERRARSFVQAPPEHRTRKWTCTFGIHPMLLSRGAHYLRRKTGSTFPHDAPRAASRYLRRSGFKHRAGLVEPAIALETAVQLQILVELSDIGGLHGCEL